MSAPLGGADRCVAAQRSAPHVIGEPKFLLPVVVLAEPLLGRTPWPS
jgi:hypothetical protein